MKWILCMVVLSITLMQLAMSNDEVQTGHDALDKETVIEEIINNEKDGHSDVKINAQDLNTDDSSISDLSELNVLLEKIDENENNDIDDSNHEKISMNDDPVKISDQDKALQDESIPNLVSSEIVSDKVEEVMEYLNEQTEAPLVSDNNDNVNPTPQQKEEVELSEIISETDDDKADVQKDETDTRASTKKQRYFPLLYTFGSMFSSFLAEFGDVSGSSDSTSSNTSVVKNSTSEEDLALNSNATSNSTDQGKKTRFQCALQEKNSTNELNETALVKIINSTELLEILNFSKNQKSAASPCVLVMFYTKWCHFSAQAAPEYNALARAFPQLDVLAVDTSHFSYLNAKFGTVAVPNIMIFHSRSAVRFNHTARDLDHFIQFVHNNTGLEATSSVAVLPEDFEGPLSSKVVQGRDWLLWLAWAFILVCSIYGFFFSLYGQAVIMRLRVLWAEHQHIE